jgi:hypothetical protein
MKIRLIMSINTSYVMYVFLSADEVSRKRTKSGRKDMTERKSKLGEREFTGWPPCLPWGDYAEELIRLLLKGRRSETDSCWLGCDAGEYCGETGESCEAGVLSTCEPAEKEVHAVLACEILSTCEPEEKDEPAPNHKIETPERSALLTLAGVPSEGGRGLVAE